MAATSGVCSAGLATTAISRDQRRCDLADENREREIPGRNADKDAASMPTQDIGFARRARQRHVGAENPRLAGVVAAKIGRLAHLGERIVESLAALALQQGDQRAASRLDEIGRAFDHPRPRLERQSWTIPGRRARRRDRSMRRSFIRFDDLTDDGAVDRRQDRSAPQPATRRSVARQAAEQARASRRSARQARSDRQIPRLSNWRVAAGKSRSAAAGADDARDLARRAFRKGPRQARVSGVSGSAARATKEELAPFSIKRRTR